MAARSFFLNTLQRKNLLKPANLFRLLHSPAKNDVATNRASESVFHEGDENTDHVERWELLQKVKGLDDPFQMTANTVTPGTEQAPTLIPTIYDERIVGCICKDDSLVIKWTKLQLGENKKCDCGHWFKLVPLEE